MTFAEATRLTTTLGTPLTARVLAAGAKRETQRPTPYEEVIARLRAEGWSTEAIQREVRALWDKRR